MLNKFILSGAVTLGLMTTAIAGPYYAGLSYVDSEYAQLEGNGYAITVGRNIDLLSNVDTAVQITYAELGDDSFVELGDDEFDDDTLVNVDATSIEIAAVFAYDAGFAKPFVILGYEVTDLDISAVGYSETIDDDGFYYGIGLDYSLGENLGLRFEMTYDEFTDDLGEEFDVESLRLGFVRSF